MRAYNVLRLIPRWAAACTLLPRSDDPGTCMMQVGYCGSATRSMSQALIPPSAVLAIAVG
jgi:hypothetical protein